MRGSKIISYAHFQCAEMADADSYSYSDRSSTESSDYDSSPEELEGERYFVTKESQQNLTEPTRKASYAGMRDLSDPDKIQEKDIVAPDGSVMGVQNRVRAGLANYENREALKQVRLRCSYKGGGAGCYCNPFAEEERRGENYRVCNQF